MIVEIIKNTTVITQEKKAVSELAKAIEDKYTEFENNNIVINLFSFEDLQLSDVLELKLLSDKHRAAKHSFVIVSKAISYDEAPEEIEVVPTLQEAHDLIEMEEIERDLGF